MVSAWSAPCDTPTQATLVLGGYPELDEVLAATRLQAEGVFELFKNFLESGESGMEITFTQNSLIGSSKR
jgi:hypothetical protein